MRKRCACRSAIRRALCALLAMVLLLAGAELAPVRAESGGLVRVKLTRLGTPLELVLTADCDYVCSGEFSLNIPAGSTVTLRADGDALHLSCDGVELNCGSGAQLLRCGSGGVRFQSPELANVFCGDLYLSASGSAITAVLHLPMEDYLCGVVGYEMSNSYPLEALKAQAVAARNYALKKMSTQASRSYDVVDTSTDQVFRGYNASQTRVIQAVQETAGMALYSGSTLASCYYSASNGGQTESTKNAWGNSLSYSVVKDDPYDLGNTGAKKTTARIAKDANDLHPSLEIALLEGVRDVLAGQKLSQDAADVRILSIERISAKNPKYAEPSRLYRTLGFELRVQSRRPSDGALVTLATTVDVPTYGGLENWYGLSINSSSNETVEVTDEGECFCVTFRRWGHGIGMSQRGAQAMARDYGMSAQEILTFYYPGTELRSVSLAGASYASPAGGGEAVATAYASGKLTLYANASGESVCAKLDDGLMLRVLGAQGGRALVEVRGLQAWAEVEGLRDYALIGETFESASGDMALSADANLLELPLEGARTIEVLLAGTRVRLLERSESWALAETEGGMRGYLPVMLLCEAEPSETPEPSAETSPEPTETLEPTGTPEATVTATVLPTVSTTPTATATATIEPTATTSATASATPAAAATATASAMPTASATPTVTLNPTRTPAPTLRPDPTAVDRPLPTGSPLPTLEPARAPEGAEGMFVPIGTLYNYVRVSSGSALTLRSKPSTSAAAVGTLARGARVRVLAFDEAWALVEATGGVRGFAALRYLSAVAVPEDQPTAEDVLHTPAPTEAPEEEDSVQIVDLDVVFCDISARTTAAAAMYRKNSTSGSRVCTIPAGAKLTVTAYDKSWAYVKYGSRRGFVQLRYLKK
ncbi:MAG: SpoIID/LytB domain-containing protein [Clostridia bacterium]|nr:SpoIID/LytB domain-containing protein [Clostridia bacterium]